MHAGATGVEIGQLIPLTETVPRIGYREGPILLGGNLDVIRFAVVFRSRRSLLALRRVHRRRNGHRRLRLIEFIRDKHSRNGVFLAAE